MLICFIDVALLIGGLVFLIMLMVNGSLPVANNRELRGAPGYIAATLLMLPLPITFLIGCGMGVNAVRKGQQDVDVDKGTAILAEVIPLVVCLAGAGLVAALGSKPKRRKKKKKRPLDDEYDDYEDRPARRRRLDEEDDEQEERPSRSRRRDEDDDEDDVPRRRKRVDDDEDDDYRPPRRRRDED